MKKILLLPLSALLLASCAGSGSRGVAPEPAAADTTADTMLFVSRADAGPVGLTIMRLNDKAAYLTLADSVIPSINDSTIALCVEAAFTGELLDEFKTTNIAGDYVIDGIIHKGYDCDANSGFLYAGKDTVVIAPMEQRADWTAKAVSDGGMLFEQMMIIHNGANVYPGKPITPSVRHYYRTAAKLTGGDFAVIQSVDSIPFSDFIDGLIDIGVQEALYLDMGRGWNYGWYRPTAGSKPVLLFDYRNRYQTNWLIVKSLR